MSKEMATIADLEGKESTYSGYLAEVEALLESAYRLKTTNFFSCACLFRRTRRPGQV